MAAELDENFCKIVRDITNDVKNYPKKDRKTIVGWLQQIGKEVQTEDEKRARNEYGRYLRYIVQSGEELPEEISAICAKDYPEPGKASTSKAVCPRLDLLSNLQPGTDLDGIAEICEDARNGDITTAAEFVYSLGPFTKDVGALFHEILEKDLNFFREIVDDTVDRRVQDEADVMMHTQNDIKQKFQSLTDAMIHRSMRIRQRLFEISPKFDWAKNGKDRAKIANLIKVKHVEMSGDPHMVEKLLHQVFMRGQWLKKELSRLQEENTNLKMFLSKFRKLAEERKAQESHVPRLLSKEKKSIEKQLACLQRAYNKNMEIVDALYVEHHRCIKPPSQMSAFEGVN